jgi:hypothetical protein
MTARRHAPQQGFARGDLTAMASGCYEPPPVAGGPTWRDAPFDKQREVLGFVGDVRALLCSRRAGKTETDAYWLIDGGLDSPGEESVFVTLSSPHAKRTLWKTFTRIQARNPELRLVLKRDEGRLVCALPNNHTIWMAGCNNSGDIAKFRGDKYRRVVIDEAQSMGAWLEELIEDALEPALVDLQGELMLSGTPGPLPQGYFYRATTGDGGPRWPTFGWTLRENPFMQHAGEWLRRKMDRNGWDETHPRYLREYCGKWVRDEGSLVFPYDGARNAAWDLPPGDWNGVTGIDFGFIDSTAWVYEQYQPSLPDCYIWDCAQRSGLIPSAFAVRHQQWLEAHKGRSLGDSGGLGKGYIEEANQRMGLNIEAAAKLEKRSAIEFMRGDLLAGTIKVHPHRCQMLIDEWGRVQWNEDHSEIDDRTPDHLSHAALYAHRECRTQYRPEEIGPEPGTAEWTNAQVKALKEKRTREAQRRLRQAANWR